jgi:hypothetical protein
VEDGRALLVGLAAIWRTPFATSNGLIATMGPQSTIQWQELWQAFHALDHK